MLVDLALFLSALLLGLVAAVLGRRKPPALDAGRLLAVCRSALLWGGVEDRDDAVEAWTTKVTDALLYHPAGRDGWAKLDAPESYEIPVPSLPTERALVEDLAGLPAGAERFARMFAEEGGRAALLDDPRAMGDDWDPGRWLGHGCDWEAVARWAEPVQAAVARRLEHHHLVVLAGPDQAEAASTLHAALAADASARLVERDGCALDDAAAEALAASLMGCVDGAADRLLLLALGDIGPLLLAGLAADPVLRDRVMGLVLDGCPLGGVPGDAPAGLSPEERAAWLQEHLTHDLFDTEIRRATPYCLIARLAPDAVPSGDGRVPWSLQRLIEPAVPPSGRRPIAVMDLGVAPAERALLDPTVEARSLLLTMAFLLGEGAPRP